MIIDTDTQVEALDAWLDEIGVSFKLRGHGRHTDDRGWVHNKYTVTLSRGDFTFSTKFRSSIGNETDPVAIDVLHCLNSDYFAGSMDLDEFIDNFGYNSDDDDMKARNESRKIHNACKAIREKMSTLFTEKELRKLEELVHDY